MKTVKNLFIYLLIVSTSLILGCQSTQVFDVPVNRSDDAGITENGPVNNRSGIQPPVYYTKVSPGRISLSVSPESYSNDGQVLGKALAALLAERGLDLGGPKPFLKIQLSESKIYEYDKLGNYYIYNAQAQIDVRQKNNNTQPAEVQNSYKFLASKYVQSKGNRSLGIDAAKRSAVENFSRQSGDWFSHVLERELSGLVSERVYLDSDMLNMFFVGFSDDSNDFERCINQLVNIISSKKGVIYCVESKRDKDYLTLDVLYRKSAFPNGLVNKKIYSSAEFNSENAAERAKEFAGLLLK